MIGKQTLVSVGIGALAGLCLFAYCVSIFAALEGVGARDWLEFVGSIVGVALTILGTAAIALFPPYFNSRRNFRRFMESCEIFKDALEIHDALGKGFYQGHAVMLRRSLNALIGSYSSVNNAKPALVFIMQSIIDEGNQVIARYQDMANAYDRSELSIEDYQLSRRNMENFFSPMLSVIDVTSHSYFRD